MASDEIANTTGSGKPQPDSETVDPKTIIVGGRRRSFSREAVDRLKESIARLGIKTPISVREDGDRLVLVTGRHRLEACIELGLEVPIRRETGSDTDAKLWEISENLHRSELTRLERDEHIAEWIRLTEERQSEAKEKAQAGGEGVSSQIAQKLSKRGRTNEGRPEGGASAAARELGIERNEARRAVHRAENIAPEVRDEIRDSPAIADSGVELDALAKATPEQQAEAVQAVKAGEARNVREALSPPPPKPKKPPKWSRDQWIDDTAIAYRAPRAELYANLDDSCRLAADAKHRHEIPLHRREWLVERWAAALGVSLTLLIKHAASTALTIRSPAEETHTTDNGSTSTELIAKLFAMLSSPNDGEVVAAARALNAALAKAGTSIVDLAQQLMEPRETFPFDIFDMTTSSGERKERLQAELKVPFSEWASRDRAKLETAIAELEEALGYLRNDPDAYARKATEHAWQREQQHEQQRAAGRESKRETRRLLRLERQLYDRRYEYRKSPEYASLAALREKKRQLRDEISDAEEKARREYAGVGTAAAA